MRTREQERAAYTYLKPARIAEQFDCTAVHVVNLIKTGKLKAINIGTGDRPEYRVNPDDFARFLETSQVNAA